MLVLLEKKLQAVVGCLTWVLSWSPNVGPQEDQQGLSFSEPRLPALGPEL